MGSITRTVFGPYCQFSPPKPVRIQEMSFWRLRKEVCGHLGGDRKVNSHFSLWTADLQTAMAYVNLGPLPHIGVLDTQRRQDVTTIMHVLALWEAGLSKWKYPVEYLVYGPVQGKSYTCMTLAWQMYPTDLFFDLWIMVSPETKLAHVRKARNRTARHSFYRVENTSFWASSGSCRDWPLILTVIAAEWGRSQAAREPFIMQRVECPRSKDMKEVISDLSGLIETAVRSPDVVLPLYNPYTYRTHLPGVDYMLHLLRDIESEIRLRRCRPQPEPFSLIDYLWPRISGQKRKTNELEATSDSETQNKIATK